MAQTRPFSPLADTSGLTPRYLRERLAAAEAARANPPSCAAAPRVAEWVHDLPPVDAVTADLRRRVAAARPARPMLLPFAAPALACASLLAGLRG